MRGEKVANTDEPRCGAVQYGTVRHSFGGAIWFINISYVKHRETVFFHSCKLKWIPPVKYIPVRDILRDNSTNWWTNFNKTFPNRWTKRRSVPSLISSHLISSHQNNTLVLTKEFTLLFKMYVELHISFPCDFGVQNATWTSHHNTRMYICVHHELPLRDLANTAVCQTFSHTDHIWNCSQSDHHHMFVCAWSDETCM